MEPSLCDSSDRPEIFGHGVDFNNYDRQRKGRRSNEKNNRGTQHNLEYVVPEKIQTHSMEGHWKFLGGRGLKSQNFRSTV